MELGPQSSSDNKFRAKCRFLQSKYRAEVLHEPFGNGPNKNSKAKYGNFLVEGENTGSNFITESSFKYAKQKSLDKQINKSLTIDEFRLFNNMLSSMPMCFNLFSDLRELLLSSPEEATRIIKLIFKEFYWINKVTYIDVEFIPIPILDYTNDKSAFDAMILAEDMNGKKELISIETKYTDLLGSNTSSDSDLKNSILEKAKIFDQELINDLKTNGYKQIHRNYLLTYVFAKKNKLKHFVNVVVSPKEDKLSVDEIKEMKSHMIKYQGSITKISLETVVKRAINCGNNEISSIMEKFHERYLNFE